MINITLDYKAIAFPTMSSNVHFPNYIETFVKVFDRCFANKFETVIKPYIQTYLEQIIDEDRSHNAEDTESNDIRSMIDNRIKELVDEYIVDKLEKAIKPIAESILNEKIEQRNRRAIGSYRRPALNNFGQESYDHMLLPYMSNLLKSSNDMNFILQKVIADLLFNPEIKKNHTVYINPDTDKYICIFKDNMWKNYKPEFVLERVVRRANDVLQHYLFGLDQEQEMQFKQEIGKKKYDILKEFTEKLDNMEDYDDFRQQTYKNTEHTILTNQHIVHRMKFEPPSD